jgi:hypothetical protein
VDRLPAVQLVTLGLAALATVFSFVAMRAATDARDHARSAADLAGFDSSHDVLQLQDALVRAGVIEDPYVIPDDHGEPDGPWGRCLTTEERVVLGSETSRGGPDDAPCASIEVVEVSCPSPEASPEDEDRIAVELCERRYLVDGQEHYLTDTVHPEDVEVDATEWATATGAPEVDRVTRTSGTTVYLHVLDEGWYAAYPDDGGYVED